MRSKGIICALAFVGATAVAFANPFTAGNLVIYRVGDGVAETSLVNTGNSIFLDEYTTAGALVQSINVTSQWAGSAFVASGTATSEGLLTISSNGQFLALTGYNRALGGVGSLSGTTAATVNRSVGVVGLNGLLASQSNFTDYADGNNPRSAVTTNGTDLWFDGGAGGVRYATAGSTTSTQLSTTTANLRQVNVFDGQLYVSTSSGSAFRVGAVGTGTPTTSGQTIANIPGGLTAGSPYGFYFADLDAGVAGVDTLYVADDTPGTINKYSLVGGTWVSNGSAAATGVRGLTGRLNVGAAGVSLFATTGASTAAGGGSLYGLVDTSGYNGALSATTTTLATASGVTAFRGVAYIPQAVPEPGTIAALGLGALALIRKRRKSK